MKKEQRYIYRQLMQLAHVEWSGLCDICRYAEFSGGCSEPDMECHCGIGKVEEDSDFVWAGDDCWTFRPLWKLEDIADAVGLILQGEYPDMSHCTRLGKRRRFQ